jgi:opacity protein-like surface antigen
MLPMRRTGLITLAGMVSVMASNVFAADLLPPPPPEPVAPPVEIGGSWYLRGDVGIAIHGKPDFTIVDTATVDNLVFPVKHLGDAPLIGIGAGYRYNSWLRFDVTGEYRGFADFKGMERGTFVSGGVTYNLNNMYEAKLGSIVGLVNAYVDLGTWNCLTPFLGVGIGVANVHFEAFTDQGIVGPVSGVVGPSIGYAGDKSKTNLAWALHAGVAYTVNPNLTMELSYRYLNMGKIESGDFINGIDLSNTRNNYLRVKSLESHDVRLGMRWTFGSGDPACGVACATPVAAVEPAPLVRKF